MPPLSWNEIRHRAIGFSKEWTYEKREHAEKQSFWNEFFEVFGIRRRLVATFEEPVRKISGQYEYIDLFWPGMVLVEHKSRGKDLGKAESQAFRYIQDLAREGRTVEIPRYIIISDFARIALHDLEPDNQLDLPLFQGRRVHSIDFGLAEFHQRIHDFAFIPGYKQHKFEEQDPINIQAVEIMGRLHDTLESGGYSGHQLERFLVRVLFCLFSEDTGIFEREAFRLYLLNRTADDGSDLGVHLARLFEVLNTPVDERQHNLDEVLATFPYVNGELFAEHLRFAEFNGDMRNSLLACTRFDWSRISPAIFGSLFQSVMISAERRQIGAHYTSERDILKVVGSLFLDELRAEFDRIKKTKTELKRFHEKLAKLRFLDPACGCGNFLVITYRELRLLEIELLQQMYSGTQQELNIQRLSLIDVDQFYGIEISQWPARIAEVAMWLLDHQMNVRLSEVFGQYFVRLPLRKSPTIVSGNALRLDWTEILPVQNCSFIIGNPPFVGQTFQAEQQKADQQLVLSHIRARGVLDYVCNWYVKAAEYIQGTRVVVGFVSTNSITQGEQVGILWTELFGRYRLKIHFAHRTFPWQSEARGKAHVHVVILGFAAFDTDTKRIYDYEAGAKKISLISAKNISPYLIEGSDRVLANRTNPLCDVPKMSWGNKPSDGGHLLLSPAERAEFLHAEPEAGELIRPYMGGHDFLNSVPRYCLWLAEVNPSELRKLPKVTERLARVREFREASKAESTRSYAKFPALFRQIAQPKEDYLALPEVSSESRPYIPMAFVSCNVICSNTIQFIVGASKYHFGVLSSAMHMAWVRQICGRLKSDYRYSNSLVYNNFPWPQEITERQRSAVEEAAQLVIAARYNFPKATLADLYDPLAMPPALAKAHSQLDRAVERCYRSQPFENDRQRIEHLFALYEKLDSPLATAPTRRRSASSK
jgi:hypothetical protein